MGLVPTLLGADHPMVTSLFEGLSPVIVGALGESPYVKALFKVADPADVFTVTPTFPPESDAGLMNFKDVPAGLSVQLVTWIPPTEMPVTPTKNEPLIVVVAPPLFGIKDLSALEIAGFCTRELAHVSVTKVESRPSWRSPYLPSPIT